VFRMSIVLETNTLHTLNLFCEILYTRRYSRAVSSCVLVGVGVSAHAHEPILSFRNLSAEFDPNIFSLRLPSKRLSASKREGGRGGSGTKDKETNKHTESSMHKPF